MNHHFSGIFDGASDEVDHSLSDQLSTSMQPSSLHAALSDRSASDPSPSNFSSQHRSPQMPPTNTSSSSGSAPSPSPPLRSTTTQPSRFKRILKKFFGPSDRPRLTPDQLGDKLNSEFFGGKTTPAPKTPKQKKGKGIGDVVTTGVVVKSPNTPPLPNFRDRYPFTKGKGGSGHDSKFSSISSLASLHPLSATIRLSLNSLNRLQSLIRRTKRSYQRQEYLTENLSNNLLHQLLKKTSQLSSPISSRRIKPEDKAAMNRSIFHGKECARRIFLRKAIFWQHSLGILSQLGEMVEDNRKRDAKGFMIELEFSPEAIKDFTVMMNADLKMQRHLDEELLVLMSKGAEDNRFRATAHDKIMTERFVQFLDSRVKLLGACYERTGEIIKTIEEMSRGGAGVVW